MQCNNCDSIPLHSIIAVDIEGDLGRNGHLSIIQLYGGGDEVYIFDLLIVPELMKKCGLDNLLTSPVYLKLFHDCRKDTEALYYQFDVKVCNVFDTQAAYSVIHNLASNNRVGLNTVLAEYGSGQVNDLKEGFQHGIWNERPLPTHALEYASKDVNFMISAYHSMKNALDESG